MKCKFCEAENPENALYCPACGKRQDGMTVCPRCKEPSPEGSDFCIRCGKPLHSRCRKHAAQDDPQREETVKRRLRLIGESCLMAAVFVAVLFVFLMGGTASIRGNAAALGSLNIDIPSPFYYFGEAYYAVVQALTPASETQQFSPYYAVSLYLPIVFCTLIVTAALTCTLIFAVLSVVRFVRGRLQKTQKSAAPFAFAAYFSFVAGAALYVAMHAVRLSISNTDGAVLYEGALRVTYNGATLAGIVLGAIALAAYAGCCAAAKGRALLNGRAAVRSVITAAGIVCLCVMMGMLCVPPAQMSATGSVELGFGTMFTVFGDGGSTLTPTDPVPPELLVGTVFAAIGVAMQICLAALCAALLTRLCLDLAEDPAREKVPRARGVAVLVLTVLAAASAEMTALCGVVTGIAMRIGDAPFSGSVPTYAAIIVLCEFAVLALAAAVLYLIFSEKKPSEAGDVSDESAPETAVGTDGEETDGSVAEDAAMQSACEQTEADPDAQSEAAQPQ